MKAMFYAKRLSTGHVYLDTFEIPDGSMEWRIPVRQPMSVKAGNDLPPANIGDNVRVFRLQYNPIQRALGDLPKFLEE